MNKKIWTALCAGLCAALLNLNPAVAQEDHKAEATRHALAAAEAGMKGDAKAAGEHAAAAKIHAEAAGKEKANPHLEAGIGDLNHAIEEAGKGRAEHAGEAAQAAATHLKAAEKSF